MIRRAVLGGLAAFGLSVKSTLARRCWPCVDKTNCGGFPGFDRYCRNSKCVYCPTGTTITRCPPPAGVEVDCCATHTHWCDSGLRGGNSCAVCMAA